ncbi:MAG: endopeptidase La [Chloroflexi bacterium]|nr:endopeptidase La [Chloroflexota bacterium]
MTEAETSQNSGPSAYPLVVLGEMVIMPQMTVPLQIGQGKSFRALEVAWDSQQPVLLIYVPEHEIEQYKSGTPPIMPKVGVIARLEEFIKLPDGTARIILEGLQRAVIDELMQIEPFYVVAAHGVEDHVVTNMDIEALMETVKQQVDEFVDHLGEVPPEAVAFVRRIDAPGHLADIVTYAPAFDFAERMTILTELDPVERLRYTQRMLARHLELMKLRQKIQQETKEILDQGQKEYFLREQIRVIRRELGEDEELDDPVDELKKKIQSMDAPDPIRDQALSEYRRLAQQGPGSPEASVIRNYIEWLLTLPWKLEELATIEIQRAQQVLDEDHFGLEKVKERILEYIAVRKLVGANMRSPILCLVGPPGVGKTSLGRSIARALDRKFVRMSLGGVRDEAEIRGHRRTYIGAMPGRIIQGMKTAKSRAPVFVLDEIDKVGQDFRGDPTSALLEVLDPEQNSTFADHYLEVPFDLSQVVFVATANQLDTIPAPLRDRMEIIEVNGYTEEEKLGIATRFLLPKQLTAHGLTTDTLVMSDDAIMQIIRTYTRESGVRSLEREVAAICRKVARRVAETGDTSLTSVDADQVPDYLGVDRFSYGLAESMDEVGVATGVAWTSVGGETLTIEVQPIKGKGAIQLTGRLGDVMKESAHAAMTYARAQASVWGVESNYFDEHIMHVHIPEGAVPKDGPSAGITLTTALISAMTGKKVRRDVAMTGEVTLRGKVLPIGGLKEKTLAAHRAGIKTFVLPQANAKDIAELPQRIRDELALIPVSTMDEVLKIALID